jgi:hypothetical protein
LIIGRNNSGDATTVLERSGIAANTAFLIRNNDNGDGFRAVANGTTAGFTGVRAESSQGPGVSAVTSATSPAFAGVEAQSSEGPGLAAESSAGPGIQAISDRGVAVDAQSKQNFGVRGQGVQSGVIGFSRSDNGAGVTGVATRGVLGFGSTIGVFGEHRSLGGLVQSGFQNVGVGGRSNAHHGIFGFSDAPLNSRMISAGVAGQSQSDVGVAGECAGTDIGVLGRCHANGAAGVVGRSRDGVGVHGSTLNGFAGTFDGDVVVLGDVTVTGRKSAVVAHPDGSHRALYAVESPESWFEDFGSARLVRGRARVRLDRDFAVLIRRNDYHVFLTPEGDSQGLYVAKKTSRGFDVLEQQSGQSTVRFSFRIVARRPDLRGKRLEKVRMPKKLKGLDRKILAPKPFRRPAMADLATKLKSKKRKR